TCALPISELVTSPSMTAPARRRAWSSRELRAACVSMMVPQWVVAPRGGAGGGPGEHGMVSPGPVRSRSDDLTVLPSRAVERVGRGLVQEALRDLDLDVHSLLVHVAVQADRAPDHPAGAVGEGLGDRLAAGLIHRGGEPAALGGRIHVEDLERGLCLLGVLRVQDDAARDVRLDLRLDDLADLLGEQPGQELQRAGQAAELVDLLRPGAEEDP